MDRCPQVINLESVPRPNEYGKRSVRVLIGYVKEVGQNDLPDDTPSFEAKWISRDREGAIKNGTLFHDEPASHAPGVC